MENTQSAVALRPTLLLQALEFHVQHGDTVMVVGPPGVGKTDIGKYLGRKLKCDILLMHPSVEEPTNYMGLPWALEGEATFLPFGHLKQIISTTRRTLVIMDDFGQANVSVQAAAMQLLWGGQINGHKISDKVSFLLLTNDTKHKAGVNPIIEPVKGRCRAIYNFQFHIDDWEEWAWQHGQPEQMIAFGRFNPEVFGRWQPTKELVNQPCPRTIANAGDSFRRQPPEEILYSTIAGAAGQGLAGEFMTFLRVFESLPNPDYVLDNPEKLQVDENKLDVMTALAGSISARATKKNMRQVVAVASRLPKTFEMLTVLWAVKRDADLQETTAFIDWVAENPWALQ